jgi:uncharacterized protein (DUF2141 family)
MILSAGCAKIEAPPGGPVDKTGPSLISTYPTDRAIGVGKSEKITIQFSENVDHKSVEQSIFISPHLAIKPKYKWHGRTLDIIMPDSLKDSTTYIINVGANVVDLRNNKMANSQTFAFTTGSEIAGGEIKGTILQDGKPSTGISIGLFEKWMTSFDSIYPPFLTQSGNNGEFQLPYLPDGDYFILAFNDKNKNNLFDYGKEPYGLSDRNPIISAMAPSAKINFQMIKEGVDTGPISIVSITVTADHLIRARLSGRLAISKLFNNLDKVYLIKKDSAEEGANPAGIIELETDTLSNFTLYFDHLEDGEYRLKIDTIAAGYINDSTPYLESSLFAVKLEPDKNAPKVENIIMAAPIIFPNQNEILVQFSEPLDSKSLTDSLITIMRDDSTYNNFRWRWINQAKGKVIVDSLQWGQKFIFKLNSRYLIDLAGNSGGDSAKTLTFITYNEDSLGTVSGTIKFGPEVDSIGIVGLIFRSSDNKNIFQRSVGGGSFSYSFPPGKYILSGYIDHNGNGQYDFGTLFPLSLAESVAIYSDTVRIRSRFETAGIDLHFQ